MRILAFGGSLREASFNRTLLAESLLAAIAGAGQALIVLTPVWG